MAPREPGAVQQPRFANRWPLEQRMLQAVLLAMLPSTLTALVLLWLGDYPDRVRWTLVAAIVVASAGGVFYLRDRVAYSLRTIANLLSAIREGDFSIRLRPTRTDSALDELVDEANALRDVLHAQRIQVAESAALLDRVLSGIDVAVLAFDSRHRLRRANKQAEALLGARYEDLEGATADSLGFADCLTGPGLRVATLPGDASGRRWEMRRTTIRQYGEPLQLILLWDVTSALRSEQQEAWSRLVRVMRHEINNSLAPISSLAATMLQIVGEDPPPPDWRADLREGLEVVVERSAAVVRMLQSYTQLSSEPPPIKREVDVAALVRRTVAGETRATVIMVPGEDVRVMADVDQLDQALINLVRNAVDANAATGGRASIGWSVHRDRTGGGPRAQESLAPVLEIWVEDEGPGLLNGDNLFVPFFTTKPGGSGVGLALARQIAEAHGGSLSLANRTGANGCRSTLRIPLR